MRRNAPHIAPKQRTEGQQYGSGEHAGNPNKSSSRPSYRPRARLATSGIPSDISGVRSSTFHRPHVTGDAIPSTSISPVGSHRQNKGPHHGYEDSDYETMGTVFLTGGFQSAEMNNIVSAAKKNDRRKSRFPRNSRIYVHFPCPRKTVYAICLLLLVFLVPMVTVRLLSGKSDNRVLDGNPARLILAQLHRSLDTTSKSTRARAMWHNHIVVTDTNRILIPESFESRYNAEVAPVLENHVDRLWDDTTTKKLECEPGEHLLVAFSLTKSGSLPAGISYERPCTFHHQSERCAQEKRVSDIRDLALTLPSVSSRHTFAVKVGEDRAAKQDNSDVPTPRRLMPFGKISGPFQVELSDGARLVVQRYCGTHRENFAEDLDILPVTKENTRILTIYELKRLFSLWAASSRHLLSASGNIWDRLQLSRISIDPVDHSRHTFSLNQLTNLLLSPLLPSTNAETTEQLYDRRPKSSTSTAKDGDPKQSPPGATESRPPEGVASSTDPMESLQDTNSNSELSGTEAEGTEGPGDGKQGRHVGETEDHLSRPSDSPPLPSTISPSTTNQILSSSNILNTEISKQKGTSQNERASMSGSNRPVRDDSPELEIVPEEAEEVEEDSPQESDMNARERNAEEAKAHVEHSIPQAQYHEQRRQQPNLHQQPSRPTGNSKPQPTPSVPQSQYPTQPKPRRMRRKRRPPPLGQQQPPTLPQTNIPLEGPQPPHPPPERQSTLPPATPEQPPTQQELDVALKGSPQAPLVPQRESIPPPPPIQQRSPSQAQPSVALDTPQQPPNPPRQQSIPSPATLQQQPPTQQPPQVPLEGPQQAGIPPQRQFISQTAPLQQQGPNQQQPNAVLEAPPKYPIPLQRQSNLAPPSMQQHVLPQQQANMAARASQQTPTRPRRQSIPAPPLMQQQSVTQQEQNVAVEGGRPYLVAPPGQITTPGPRPTGQQRGGLQPTGLVPHFGKGVTRGRPIANGGSQNGGTFYRQPSNTVYSGGTRSVTQAAAAPGRGVSVHGQIARGHSGGDGSGLVKQGTPASQSRALYTQEADGRM